MKLPITISYNSGEEVTYVAQPPEWQKWEQKTGNIIGQASEKMGISDLMFLAYHAYKREAGGKPVKSFDNWIDTVSEFDTVKDGDADPKVIPQEA